MTHADWKLLLLAFAGSAIAVALLAYLEGRFPDDRQNGAIITVLALASVVAVLVAAFVLDH